MICTSSHNDWQSDKYRTYSISGNRGKDANYQGEWESNLDSGESGNIKGFNDASLVVLSRLNDYLKDNKITDYKLLITGYSRAAAISSLVGVHINDNLYEYKIDDDDLYVYSFESPRYSSSKIKYDNIHNVINKMIL